jgi:hypothetical protein
MVRLTLALVPLLLTVGLAAPMPRLQHVFLFVLESQNPQGVIGNTNMPQFNALATTYARATNYTAITHPALPNFTAMITGNDHDLPSNAPGKPFTGDNLALQLEQAGLSWHAYQQGLPAAGAPSSRVGSGKKQSPFMLNTDIMNSAARRMNVVPFEQLQTDLRAGSVPNFSYLALDPCGVTPAVSCLRDGDRTEDVLIGNLTAQILGSPVWKEGTAIIITFAEGNRGDTAGGGGHVATLVLTPNGPRGLSSNLAYNHYSLLRTLEEGFGLPLLGGAKTNAAMSELFLK